jgi:hypothetical protein
MNGIRIFLVAYRLSCINSSADPNKITLYGERILFATASSTYMMIMEQRKSEGKQDDDDEDQEEEENAESSCTTMVATMVPRLEQG